MQVTLTEGSGNMGFIQRPAGGNIPDMIGL
jgi:hypothetical protein